MIFAELKASSRSAQGHTTGTGEARGGETQLKAHEIVAGESVSRILSAPRS
jgi:hypothetical protein